MLENTRWRTTKEKPAEEKEISASKMERRLLGKDFLMVQRVHLAMNATHAGN